MKTRILVSFERIVGGLTQRVTSVQFRFIAIETGAFVPKDTEFQVDQWWVTGSLKDLGDVEFCNMDNIIKVIDDDGHVEIKMNFPRKTENFGPGIVLHFTLKERFEDQYALEEEGHVISSDPFRISSRKNIHYSHFPSARLMWITTLKDIANQYNED